MTGRGSAPVFVATGPYGLVGRGLFDIFPELVPLDLAPPPSEMAARINSSWPVRPVDITEAGQVSSALRSIASAAGPRPLVVIHLAALTDTKSERQDLFEKVNVQGTKNVLQALGEVGGSLIHISTDYVFYSDRRREGPYREEDRPARCPDNPYAASKFHAENWVLDASGKVPVAVARIAFPYGGQGNRPGLAEKMISWFEKARSERRPVRLFSDQWICPSYVPDVHRGLGRLAEALASGRVSGRRVFHLTGFRTTPFEFGEELRRAFGFEDVPLEPSPVDAGAPSHLWLSHESTIRALDWAPTPLVRALNEFKSRRP